MTPEQWAAYGGCPTCDARPAAPCRNIGVRGDELEAPHPGRPFTFTPDSAARLLDDVVDVSVREGVTVHPGDTLVLRIDPPDVRWADEWATLNGEMEAMGAHIQARLPRGARVVVVAASGDLGVVRGSETPGTPVAATDGDEPPSVRGAAVDLGRVGPQDTQGVGPEGETPGPVR